ncbi:MCP methyltransferase, CheR-type [Desulfuromonas soudanensis]|uniref:protein-glutamate O-methyltransferase n=1 Tax=Desulfuromonas soudanensis TaxID=1603606 RepID=A0A0M4DLH5_9BACT|nr:protein-glutamate O-methyltransferase CheR [Desulfuromonas soudanensis]ALC18270.1 MCP methyltransferase, CheR-type [Desulfuromonas soudanensis]
MDRRASGTQHPAPFVGSDFTEEDFEAVRLHLLQERGIDLGMYKDRCIKRRIATRVRARGFHAPGPYLEVLRREPEEVTALLAALTIHVSQFFRNPSTFAVLEGVVLPELVARASEEGRREVRLWSLGCAAGEEPYSLALLAESLAPEVQISILGTDLSPAVLERAREGLYDAQRLVEVPEAVLNRYFSEEGREFRLSRSIREKVRFECRNILDSGAYPPADLILCRNVLIYFGRRDQETILSRVAAVLPSGGYLVLGRAETLPGEVRGLFHVAFPAERIYRKL